MMNVKRLSLSAMALVMCMTLAARAQVMTVVPSDSMAVIKIKNVKDVSDKVAALSDAWGLTRMRPELKDPLGFLLSSGNMGPGLNKTGEAAIAIMMPKGNADPDIVILVPVTDFKAFAGSLPGAKEEGDMYTFSPDGKPGYCKAWGAYAALSPKKEMVAAAGKGIAAAGVTGKEMSAKDIVGWVNMKMVRDELLPELKENKAKILKEIEKGMTNAPNFNPKYVGVFKAYIGQFLNVAEQFLTDAESASLGLNLGNDGISSSLVSEFAPTGYLGKAFAAMKGTDGSMTMGLPEGKYLVYGGMTVDKAGLALAGDFLAPIEKEIAALGDEGKAIQAYVDGMKEVVGNTTSSVFGVVAPKATDMGVDAMLKVVGVGTGDAAKIQAANTKMMQSQADLLKVMGADAAGVKSTLTPGGKTIEGVKLDEIVTNFGGGDPQMAMMMTLFYGPRGMPGGVKLPPNLPPFGFAVSTEGSAIRIDGFAPSQTVQSLIAAGMQIYLQQMPGGAQ